MNKHAKLIVIEGSDGCGKQTQTALVYNSLKQKYNGMQISFPDYDSDGSIPVKKYLNGELGTVDKYSAAVLFATDRYITWKTKLQEHYEDLDFIISDRYTISNLIHQAVDLDDKEFNEYRDWLFDLEWTKMGLPKPDLTIMLDMPPAMSDELIQGRKNKMTGKDELDILERDKQHKRKAYKNIQRIIKSDDVVCVKCYDWRGDIRSILDIKSEILDIISEFMQTNKI